MRWVCLMRSPLCHEGFFSEFSAFPPSKPGGTPFSLGWECAAEPTEFHKSIPCSRVKMDYWGSTGGTAMRALASHHYGPGFDSRTRHHMWVEFVGSFLCFEGFSPGSPVFLPPQKPTLIRSRLCSMTRHESYGSSQRRPCMPSTQPRWAVSPQFSH